MTVKEIREAIKVIGKSVRQIEQELGMPSSTLNKAFLGKRDLPEKWVMPLLEMSNPSKKEAGKIVDLVVYADNPVDFDKVVDEMINNPGGVIGQIDILEPEATTLERQDSLKKGRVSNITPLSDEDIFDGTKTTQLILDDMEERDNLRFQAPRPWIKQVDAFCTDHNCTPQDLMDNFKAVKKPDSDWLKNLWNKSVD